MKILVIGKNGQLGKSIKKVLANSEQHNEYIFVGYDAWAVIHTSTNPVGPLMMSTYITPQSVTGSIVGNNYQIILPPNFPNVIFYKNGTYTIPSTTDFGLSTN